MRRNLLLTVFLTILSLNFAFAQGRFNDHQPPESWLVFDLDAEQNAARPACTLPPPMGLQATRITANSIRIQWEPVQGAVGYRIQVIHVGSGQTVGTHNVTTNFFTRTGLQPGQLYTFVVRARCPNPPGGFSETPAMLTERTAYIIVDIVLQRCCPEAPDSTVQAANSTTNYALTLGAGDYWHIRAEKFGSETTYIDFCIADSCPEFKFLVFESMNAPTITNTGSQVTVRYQKTSTTVADWFVLKNITCDPTAVNATFSITWKIKTEVFDEYCPAWAPPVSGSDERGDEVLEFDEGSDLQALPNPFGEFLRISLPQNEDLPAEIRLLDSQGKLIESRQEIGSSFEMATGHLPKGLYFLQVRAGEFSETVRVVKVE